MIRNGEVTCIILVLYMYLNNLAALFHFSPQSYGVFLGEMNSSFVKILHFNCLDLASKCHANSFFTGGKR